MTLRIPLHDSLAQEKVKGFKMQGQMRLSACWRTSLFTPFFFLGIINTIVTVAKVASQITRGLSKSRWTQANELLLTASGLQRQLHNEIYFPPK